MTAVELLLALLALLDFASGLKLTMLRVPSQKLRSSDVTLKCFYDLQNGTLYSVQWYKDNSVFYRFVPADTPSGQMFPLPGVTVDLKGSNDNQVILRLLDLDSSGTYRCEVSSEAPEFLTEVAEAHMNVMALPKDPPKITGLRQKYNEGDPINLNCTSAPSKPLAVLYWFINGNQIIPTGKDSKDGPFLTQYRSVTDEEGLEYVTLGLRLAAKKKFFNNLLHTMKIRCTSSMGVLMWHVDLSTHIHAVSAASLTSCFLQTVWLLSAFSYLFAHKFCANLL
ncbi:V-set and immunoglobulin domain-containing protein 1-like isoform X2 [Neocloeon triangulifer]|uniref:V-set and immunoglobulin domain-containing protein 1-like isoform X2 n=1 Tax=Neocloeon triangulifer TaxID=2078957 RepID=UPI00286F963C|nr:V-set and immunoglobulin domain-containing protein 1-like isoform X2 [Neocloeon triangulifer]